MSLMKKIYLLIGQKGSGKSFAGQIIQDLYGIKFVRVEEIAKRVKRDRAVDDRKYHNEVFFHIESKLRKVLKNNSSVVFESTGVGSAFERMLENLQKDFNVITIGIKADPELCLERLKSRDQSIHINVSDEDVKYINSMVLHRNFSCDYEIHNNGSREELISSLEIIFRSGDKYP